MKKFSRAVLAASVSVTLSLSVVVPAQAETGASYEEVTTSTVSSTFDTEDPEAGLSSELDVESSSKEEDDAEFEQSSQGERIALGLGISAALLAAIAGGVFWAVQQGIIPNPLPGMIPSPKAPAPAPKPAPAPAYYSRCADVWNALGRPIYPSDPGFRSKFDRDGDGVGCERDPR